MADEATLPTQDEIAQLPRWARVAFAARCARRVLPTFRSHWPRAIVKLRQLRRAVEVVESTATNGSRDLQSLHESAATAERVNELVHHELQGMGGADDVGAGPIAAHASRCVINALQTAADEAVSPAIVSLTVHSAWACQISLAALTGDFRLLERLARSQHWTDATPVPPSVFDTADAFVLEMRTTEGTEPHIIGAAVVRLWEAANEYHMARGGGVLTFDEFTQMMPALVPVGPKSEG